MTIASYFPYDPTTGQWMAVNMLDAFFESTQQVFVLQGYAGTGKTTLLKVVLDYLEDKDTTCRLMASTGRAARVLSLKTKRQAATIHSTIYQIDHAKSVIGEESKTIAFKLKDNSDPLKTVYFIDESSMIADKTEANTMLLFDDGRFLQHIFRYAGTRKIVFIGDVAQLPPVNCSFSAALDADYLRKTYHREVVSICLTEVKRQAGECGIIHNATLLREQLFSSKIPPLSLDASNWADLEVVPNIWVALSQYSNLIRKSGYEQAIMISYSNNGVFYLNSQIRKNLFKTAEPPLQTNEWLLVVQNNSATGYSNGQHIWLRSFHDRGEMVGSVHLIDAIVEDPGTEKTKEIKLVYDLIFRKEPNLTLLEEQEFSRDFAIRMKKKGIKSGTDDYMFNLINDKRMNALRVKFGYAITCHKSQGGEWPQVFLNLEPVLEKMTREMQYRWLYTAITRACEKLILPQHVMLY